MTAKGRRLVCSLLAVAAGWSIGAAYHAYLEWRFWHGIPWADQLHLTWVGLRSWLIWTAVVCLIGWVLVGLPIVQWGERAERAAIWRLVLLAGASGFAMLLVPTLIWSVGVGEPEALLHLYAWAFCAWGFAIAAMGMLFYRLFLWLMRPGERSIPGKKSV